MNASGGMQQCLYSYLLQALKEITPNTYNGGEVIDYTLEGPHERTTMSSTVECSRQKHNVNYTEIFQIFNCIGMIKI